MGRARNVGVWTQRIAIAAVVALVVGFAVRVGSSSSQSLDFRDASIWLVSGATGQVVQADAGSGEVTARVEVGSPGDSLAVTQHGADALVLNRTTGEVVRVNGSLLATAERSPVAAVTDAVLLGRGDTARIVTPGAVLPVDPRTAAVGDAVTIPTITSPALDATGAVWGLDPQRHVLVVTADVRQVTVPDQTRPFAVVDAGGAAQLVDGSGPALRALESGEGLGTSSCVGGDIGPGVAVGGSVDAGHTVVMVDPSTATVHLSDLDTGHCTSAAIEGAAGARFGASVESGGLAYVPIATTGEVVVLRVAEGTVVKRFSVTTPGTPFELTVKDGTVWFNEPDGQHAGVLTADGVTEQVDKYQQVQVSGATEGTGQPGEDQQTPGANNNGTGGTAVGTQTEPGPGQPGPQPTDGTSDAGGGSATSVNTNGGADGPVEDAPLDGLVADFTFSKRVVEVGEEVTFADQSQGGPVAWTWEFGDGSFATGRNATHTWDAVGAYRVTLRIEGETGTAAASATIEVIDENTRNRPNADFRYSASRIEVGQAVTFTDRSTGNPSRLTWDFGDGATATGSTVQHSWPRAGTYQVALTAENPLGRDTSPPATITVFDRVEAPTAVIAASSGEASVNQTVTFTSQSTGNPTTLEWTFGDGTSARGDRVSHAWTSPGTYTVKLKVGNSAGQSEATTRVTVDQRVVVPEARLVASATTAEENQQIRFTSLSINNPTSLSWDFGDGSPTASGTSVTHAYSRANRYTVTLRATNDAGTGVATTTIVVVADVPAPVAAFGFAPEAVTAGVPVQFTDQSTGGAPTSWSWNFGDGTSPSSLRNPTHVFNEEGRYTVRLSVENSGGPDFVERTIEVKPPAPRPDFTFPATGNNAGQPVQFTDTTENVTPDTTWSWNFGDGTATSTERNPRHTFAERRSYDVTLTVTNGGGRASATKRIDINPRPPAANFRYSPGSSITTATEVQFTFVQANNTGVPDTYSWSFGDGSTSTEANPKHTFPRAGSFPVTLTVQNAGGTSTSPAQTVRVTAQPPAASFTAPATGVVGVPVTFTNTTPSAAGVTYAWDFGDGSTSTAANPPAHSYTAARTYNVTLRATIDGVSSPVATRSIRIYPAIVAGFTAPTTVNSGQNVTFDNTTTGADSYSWNFGDGSAADTRRNPTHVFTNLGTGPQTFTVHLVASNGGGDAPEVTRTITVRAALPVADFDMTGAPDGTVTVRYKQTPDAGTPAHYEWEFSDGFAAPDAATVSHVFTGTGQRRVRLVVRNESGPSAASAWQNVPGYPGTLDFDWSPGVLLPDTEVRFTNRSSGSPSLVEWDFDDDGKVDDTGTTSAPVKVDPGQTIRMWVTYDFWGRIEVRRDVTLLGN